MKLLTIARDLRRRRARERQRLFVAEGVRSVEELLRSSLVVRGVLVAPQLGGAQRGAALLDLLRQRDAAVTEVTEREFASAAETDSPQGVLAVGEIPDRALDELPPDGPLRLVLLDGVQDPGNVGTIVRTAAALGASATLALPGTVDLWNAKVVRSAMGAQFHHLALGCTWEEIDSFHARVRLKLWGADSAGDPFTGDEERDWPERLALVVGNEGTGLGPAARARLDRTIALPISPLVESLNVAVAAGILLFELGTRK
ncbi:MAG: TrmH family RNA methyltransferase [Gemmatimonadaceae bacterium]